MMPPYMSVKVTQTTTPGTYSLRRREESRGGTSVLYLYGYVPPNGVLILKLLIQNGVSISEVFPTTGFNISKTRKLQFCKQPFEIIQGQIAFKNTVQWVNKQTVVLLFHLRTEYKKLAHFQNEVSVLGRILERGIKNWPTSRTGYQFQGKFFSELTGCQFGVPGGTYPLKKFPSAPPPPLSGKSPTDLLHVQGIVSRRLQFFVLIREDQKV